MSLVISNFTKVNRAALFPARVAVGAAVSSGDGGIWGVGGPPRHPPQHGAPPGVGGGGPPPNK